MGGNIANNPVARHNYEITDTLEARNCAFSGLRLSLLEMVKLI